MHVIEAALFTNLASKSRKVAEAPQSGLSRRAALRRALAAVTAIGAIVLALQVASAGAAMHPGGGQAASLTELR